MKKDIKRWIKKDGVVFFKDIGIKVGQVILDFGCNRGHYTISASKVVGAKGKVYAFDKDKNALTELEETAKKFSLKNIQLINGDTKVPLGDNSVDVALCYDVIHYGKWKERKIIYSEVYRILTKEGIFSVYPKHHKEDYPLNELADVNLSEVIKEIENAGFTLEHKFSKELLHDDYYNEGYIFNFTPLDKKEDSNKWSLKS